MTKKTITKLVEKGLFINFLQKADENYKTAEKALKDRSFNSAVVSAVHAVISAADAYCVFNLGKRSASSNHEDTADLIRSTTFPDADKAMVAKRFKSIIGIKNMAEYEERLVKEKDAEKAVREALELLELVKKGFK
jgi:HEPN domain-containing protein